MTGTAFVGKLVEGGADSRDNVEFFPSRADASDDELGCIVLAGVGVDVGRMGN